MDNGCGKFLRNPDSRCINIDSIGMSNQTDHLEGEELLNAFLAKEYAGRIAVSSSFGAEFVVLLDMVARINPQTPVIFLDTGMHFPETLEYMALLQKNLG